MGGDGAKRQGLAPGVGAGGDAVVDGGAEKLLESVVGFEVETDHAVGSVTLPAGCVAAPCIYLVHRRPDLWPEPEAFDPGRFTGRRTDPYTFFPFGGGVRHCLGAAFATYEAKIVLARVLSRMTLRPAPDHAIRVVRRGLALGPSSGLPVIGTTD